MSAAPVSVPTAASTAADARPAMKKSATTEKISAQAGAAQEGPLVARVPALLKLRVDDMLAVAKQLQVRLSAAIHEPSFQVVSLSAGGGALTFGTAGGCAGLAAGSATGAAVGLVPAFFTFGLSIPAGGLVGGAVGSGLGTLLGAGGGLIGGGVAGNVVYAHRVQIKDGAVQVRCKVVDVSAQAKKSVKKAVATAKSRATDKATQTRETLRRCVLSLRKQASDKYLEARAEALKASKAARAKASKLQDGVKHVASDRGFQVSAVSAAGGAAALGAGGGVVGLTTGTVVGAAVGVVPALFTFGLSIPVGAVLGGTSGLCLGTAAGGGVGLGAGGAVGYGVFKKRQEIRSGAGKCADFVKSKAQDTTTFVKERMPWAGTGGTH